jgi:hypothetical protein
MEMVIERFMGSDGRGLKREFIGLFCYLWPFPFNRIDGMTVCSHRDDRAP